MDAVRTVRLLAVATIALIGVYFAFRLVVAACTGGACDVYIPLSLLLPLLVLAMVAVTGVTAIIQARPRPSWFGVLIVITVLGVAGPIFALLIFRDQPDVLVPAATVLELLVPIATLVFSYRPGSSGAS